MYHSIKIFPQSTEDSVTFLTEGVSTWDDFHLVPTTRPYVAPPELKSNEVDIPGSDGSIDLTESPQGYPTYQNRTGSWEFIVMNDYCQPVTTHEEWFTAYSNVMNYLHGRKFRVILEDDLSYFYEGRLTVSDYASEEKYSKITIDYNLLPYKWSILQVGDDWLWDPFNFDSGVTPSDNYGTDEYPKYILCWNYDENGLYTGLHYDSFTFNPADFGRAPINPTIYLRPIYEERVSGIRLTTKPRGAMFKIPGWSEPRLYGANWSTGFKVPEYVFRSEMTGQQLTIQVATFCSRTVADISAYPAHDRVCTNCGETMQLHADNLIGGEAGFKCRCQACRHVNDTVFRYAKEYNEIRFKFRQGGF